MSDDIRLGGATLNAPDALALAEFYAGITRGVASGDARWATSSSPGGSIGLQQVHEFRAPRWPDGDPPMQMHLELVVDDLVATDSRVVAAGATRSEFQPNADHCLVYTDPAGHPFCLTTWDDPLEP